MSREPPCSACTARAFFKCRRLTEQHTWYGRVTRTASPCLLFPQTTCPPVPQGFARQEPRCTSPRFYAFLPMCHALSNDLWFGAAKCLLRWTCVQALLNAFHRCAVKVHGEAQEYPCSSPASLCTFHEILSKVFSIVFASKRLLRPLKGSQTPRQPEPVSRMCAVPIAGRGSSSFQAHSTKCWLLHAEQRQERVRDPPELRLFYSGVPCLTIRINAKADGHQRSDDARLKWRWVYVLCLFSIIHISRPCTVSAPPA